MYMLCWNLVQEHMTNRDQGYFVFVYLFLMRFIFYCIFFLSVVHKVILVTTMLDQFSLTAMAVNYTRAQTQRGPLASHKRFVNTFQKKKTIAAFNTL